MQGYLGSMVVQVSVFTSKKTYIQGEDGTTCTERGFCPSGHKPFMWKRLETWPASWNWFA